MKPKYSIGEVVRLEKPNNKVLLRIERHVGEFENDPMYLCRWIKYPNTTGSYYQWQLKPFRPSRTGKFRNAKGQFVSEKASLKDSDCFTIAKANMKQKEHLRSKKQSLIDEVFSYTNKIWESREPKSGLSIDSKQRNYQKILGELICIRAKQDEIEKKIDELGRKA